MNAERCSLWPSVGRVTGIPESLPLAGWDPPTQLRYELRSTDTSTVVHSHVQHQACSIESQGDLNERSTGEQPLADQPLIELEVPAVGWNSSRCLERCFAASAYPTVQEV